MQTTEAHRGGHRRNLFQRRTGRPVQPPVFHAGRHDRGLAHQTLGITPPDSDPGACGAFVARRAIFPDGLNSISNFTRVYCKLDTRRVQFPDIRIWEMSCGVTRRRHAPGIPLGPSTPRVGPLGGYARRALFRISKPSRPTQVETHHVG